MLNNQKELILLKDLGMIFATATSKRKSRYSLYKCFCGSEFKAQNVAVKTGNTKSCGCFKKESNKTHGLGKHRIYGVWLDMMGRCNNDRKKSYKDYGARGITVCEDWHNIANFINDMYPSFIEGLTLDRIDNNLGYYKENCRWVTRNIQMRNTRKLISTNTSGYRGVHFYKRYNKFRSQIVVNSRQIFLGYFKDPIEAAKAYDNYIIVNILEHTKNF